MHTAVMEYQFKKEGFEKAVKIWEEEVIELAKEQPGFVRMQLLTRDNQYALAIGTWKSPEFAQAFMRTGVFIKLLDKLDAFLVGKPNPVIWQTHLFVQK